MGDPFQIDSSRSDIARHDIAFLLRLDLSDRLRSLSRFKSRMQLDKIISLFPHAFGCLGSFLGRVAENQAYIRIDGREYLQKLFLIRHMLARNQIILHIALILFIFVDADDFWIVQILFKNGSRFSGIVAEKTSICTFSSIFDKI